MDLLKAFKLDNENVQINIRGTPNKPIFQANQIGTLLGIVQIHNTIRDFDEDEKVSHTVSTLGGPQKTLFLTEMGLYRLLGMSRKPIARTFQKWVCSVLIEIRETGKYELQQQREIDKQLAKHQERLAIHNKLLNAFTKKNVIYLVWLENLEEKYYVIKIGSTADLESRVTNIVSDFGNCMLLDVFEVNYYTKCERACHDDKRIKQFKYIEIINNKNTSTETYKVDNEIYNEVLKVVKEYQELYSKICYTEILEIEKIKLQRKQIEFEIAKTKNNTRVNDDPPFVGIEDYEESSSDSDMSVEHFIKIRKSTRSPRVQKYEPIPNSNDFKLIQTYDSIIVVIRENDSFSTGGLKPACHNNTLYRGFRWFLLDRDKEIKHYNIPPTVNIREVSHELVAMLNLDKNQILHVFPSIKHASEARHFKSLAAISKAIKNNSLSSGHFWKRYHDCDEVLKVEYEKHNTLPEKPPKANGVRVQQISMSKEKKVLKEFLSISDVTKQFQMSRCSLKNASKNNTPHNGYYWKVIGVND
jgi:prophage antirepressor-like protein